MVPLRQEGKKQWAHGKAAPVIETESRLLHDAHGQTALLCLQRLVAQRPDGKLGETSPNLPSAKEWLF